MMAGENCVGQVIEARLTDRAAVTLALWLPVVMTMPGHLVTLAYWATHALGPSQTPDHVEALGLIDQGLKVDQAVHRPASSCWWRTRPRWIKPFLGHHPSPQQVAITIGSSARSPPPRNPNRAITDISVMMGAMLFACQHGHVLADQIGFAIAKSIGGGWIDGLD